MSDSQTVAVYFVASPLQYLAARRIAQQHEAGARQVLVWYKPGMRPAVDPSEWDRCIYMPWPRWEPLPGPFGVHRRLLQNLTRVAEEVGTCDRLVLHSAVFDTEAINYFLHALPRLCGARQMQARILPDGLVSVRRYPLTPTKRCLQRLRRLRRLVAPMLSYTCFDGDRIGSDASFCDRIYVLSGWPHEYPPSKVVVLPPLVDVQAQPGEAGVRRALVVGQPLTGTGLMDAVDVAGVTRRIHDWLAGLGVTRVDYKAHPKDPARELFHPDYVVTEPDCALETHMARTAYCAVAGVRSSALVMARQIYPLEVPVRAFGWASVNFKSPKEAADMRGGFQAAGVDIEP
ncbi:hypothetical protein [Methyloversatilis thermotolerans]|uniref:hypothetical protein n=1 Tax=Methyloversatilis thermotolerans TaxID=1346290 RepID=UPI00036297CB|nr:hypothetical protein [Methyloversatilis thermotolerans]